MEIQSLVRAGKMQRIKSNAVLRGAKSGGPSRSLERKVSVNSGAFTYHRVCHAGSPSMCLVLSAQAGDSEGWQESNVILAGYTL